LVRRSILNALQRLQDGLQREPPVNRDDGGDVRGQREGSSDTSTVASTLDTQEIDNDIEACPDYRVRLFLSVDLTGSTAFKAKYANEREPLEPYPIWLNRTRNFYRVFPQVLTRHFGEFTAVLAGAKDYKDMPPQVWKTVGDEIIFCIRIVCLEHLACCMRAFTKALSTYGAAINKQQSELDVKGSAWVASFPAPNVTIVSASRINTMEPSNKVGGQLSEAEETRADRLPGEYDFLGKQIDTGFRISRFAQVHELAISVDLAWLLTLLRERDLVDFRFTYRGKEILKGVIGSVPYPIITVQTERSVRRRELDELERTVANTDFAKHIELRNYLHKFMEEHEVEIPIISLHGIKYDKDKLPKCFFELGTAWQAGAREEQQRKRIKEEADAFDDSAVPTVEDKNKLNELNSSFDKAFKSYWSD